MLIKKIFYKLTNQKKYEQLKKDLAINKKIEIFKLGFEQEVLKIQKLIKNQKEISFLHSGHLGDVVNALPIIKELSKTHKCNFYLQANKPLEKHVIGYKHPKDLIYMSDKMVDMILPLLKCQQYIKKVEKYNNQKIDVNFDLFRKMPMDFNLDEVRWYFHLTGIHTNLATPYLHVEPSKTIQKKIVIMRSTRRKNLLINYRFMSKYKDLLFIGLLQEYEDLKKEVSNLEFHECKDFLEAAQIIKSSKFFLGNSSFGFTIAEGLKVPRLMESFPDYPSVYPNGGHGYDFYFQDHLEKWFDFLYNLNK
tara:strand:- start:5044 stop:5961 length:918 start_codon:yes stop_codon:yes gene_type:complete